MSTRVTTPSLLTFDVTVVRVQRLSPTFVRVTLAGAELHRFHPGGPYGPRDLRVKLIFPVPGGAVTVLPDLEPGWFPRWRGLDPAERGMMRTYSIRAARLELAVPEIDIDFVVHGDDPDSDGLGSAWAARAVAGDRAVLLGPHRDAESVLGIEWRPPVASPDRPVRVLLAADETAVPAVASILATLPPEYVGDAVLEVPDPLDVQDLPTRSGVVPTWVPRRSRPHGQRLTESVRALITPQEHAPGGPVELSEVDIDCDLLWETADPTSEPAGAAHGDYAWVAGEAATVRDIRRYLVRDCRMDRSRVAFMGYWRRGRPESD